MTYFFIIIFIFSYKAGKGFWKFLIVLWWDCGAAGFCYLPIYFLLCNIFSLSSCSGADQALLSLWSVASLSIYFIISSPSLFPLLVFRARHQGEDRNRGKESWRCRCRPENSRLCALNWSSCGQHFFHREHNLTDIEMIQRQDCELFFFFPTKWWWGLGS